MEAVDISGLSQSRRISRVELFESAIELFEGEALTWFQSVKTRIYDWEDIMRELREEYLPADYEVELWKEIRARTQGKCERIGRYFAVMTNLFSRLQTPPSEADKVNVLRRNVEPYYIHRLSSVDLYTMDELRAICRRLEDNRSNRLYKLIRGREEREEAWKLCMPSEKRAEV